MSLLLKKIAKQAVVKVRSSAYKKSNKPNLRSLV